MSQEITYQLECGEEEGPDLSREFIPSHKNNLQKFERNIFLPAFENEF